ncbi:MAG: hypothetical protein WC676_00340 [Candidatus Omnitrophota bacterium]
MRDSQGHFPKAAERFADAVILLFILLLSVVFLYLAIRYPVIKPLSRKIVFIIPVLIAGLLIIQRTPRFKNFKINSSLVIASVLLTLYIFEFLQWPWDRISTRDNVDFRSDLQVLHDLTQEGKRAVLFVPTATLIYTESARTKNANIFPFRVDKKERIPLSGVSQRTTILCKERGPWSIYESDEHGFNNPKGLYHPGDVNIAILGDSFTHGYCVDPGKDFPSQIRNTYDQKTINFGMGGAGPLMRLAIFREYVEVLKPKIVLWVYTENTLRRVEQEELLRSYLDPTFTQNLYFAQSEIDKAYEGINSFVKDARQSDHMIYQRWLQLLLLRKTQERLVEGIAELKNWKQKGQILREDYKALRQALTIERDKTTSWGGDFIFVYLPVPFMSYLSDHDAVMAIVRDLSIPAIDLSESFRKIKNPLEIYPKKGAHFNERGYKIVADGIIDALRKRN